MASTRAFVNSNLLFILLIRVNPCMSVSYGI